MTTPPSRSQRAATSGPADRQFVAALARGLSILRCFSRRERELGPTEIAAATGLPQPTVWRLCRTLLELGLLSRVKGSEKFRVGLKAARIGHALLADWTVLDTLRPDLRMLGQAFDGAVSLAGPDGLDMIFLERHQGTAFVTDERAGTRLPMARSSLGWAYLAGLPASRRNGLIRMIEERDPQMWRAMKPKFNKALRAYEATGYIVTIGTLHPQINAAAVPLKVPGREEMLALSSGGLAAYYTPERLAAAGALLTEIRRRFEGQASSSAEPRRRPVSGSRDGAAEAPRPRTRRATKPSQPAKARKAPRKRR